MNTAASANTPARNTGTRPTIGARYPEDRIKLLEAVKVRRGDDDLSETIRHALDQLIEQHFPGAIDDLTEES